MIEEITFRMKGHRTTVCRVTAGRENELGIRARFDYSCSTRHHVTVTGDFLFQVVAFAPPGVLVPFVTVAVRAKSPFARARTKLK